MKVPQFQPWLGDAEYEAIRSCFEQNWITEGPKSKLFQERLLEFTGARYGVFAPNGTLALYLALRAVGIQAGDEVIVPDFTFIATATSVNMCGAIPVFCDVNPYNFQLDAERAAELITPRTKAIMPVHIYGTSADMQSIVSFAQKHNLLIVEDAAQGIGVRYNGRHTGTFGKAGTFSFFADKTITTGEGGFIVTDDESVHRNLLYLRNQGRLNRGSFIHEEMGYNFRMTDIQNAIGLVQMDKLDEIIERKTSIWKRYQANLGDCTQLRFFQPDAKANFIPFRVGVLYRQAHEAMSFMSTKEIEARTFFYPLHRQPCFGYLTQQQPPACILDDRRFTNAIMGYEQGICLPSYPTIEMNQIDFVCETLRSFVASNG
jgi:perosamine synthetase